MLPAKRERAESKANHEILRTSFTRAFVFVFDFALLRCRGLIVILSKSKRMSDLLRACCTVRV